MKGSVSRERVEECKSVVGQANKGRIKRCKSVKESVERDRETWV